MAGRVVFSWTLERSRALLNEAVVLPKVMSGVYTERTIARAQLLEALKKRDEFKGAVIDKLGAVSSKLEHLVESLVGKRLPGWTQRKTETSAPTAFRVGSSKEDAAVYEEMHKNAQELYDLAVLGSQAKAAESLHEKWTVLTKKLDEKWCLAGTGGYRGQAWLQLTPAQRAMRLRLATRDMGRMPEAMLWGEDGEAILPRWVAWDFEADAPVEIMPDDAAIAELDEELAAKKRKTAEEQGPPELNRSFSFMMAEALQAAVAAVTSRAPAASLAAAPAHQTCTSPECDCLFTRDQLLAHPHSLVDDDDGKMVCRDCGHRVALHP